MSVNIYDKVTGELIKIAGNANGLIDDANISNKTTYSSEKIEELTKTNNNFIHISIDDVDFSISNLISNKDSYTSIFQNVFFNLLKELHDKYGAVFSLYVYNISQLSNVPDKFKNDFIESNKWLKFGLHSKTSSGSYLNETAQHGKEDWDLFISQMYRITGGLNSIDRIPRLNYFYGSKECLLAMRDCYCGALGFLSTDDSRNAYYLDEVQNKYLRTHDKLEDLENGLVFYSTDIRLDWFNSDFTTTNEYNRPVKDNVYDELVYRYNQPNMGDCYTSLIAFTHEWEIYDGNLINSKKQRIEDVCRFGVDYGYNFDFPQNRCNNINSNVLAYETFKENINDEVINVLNTFGLMYSDFERGTFEPLLGPDSTFVSFKKIDFPARARNIQYLNVSHGTFKILDTSKYNMSIIECDSKSYDGYLSGGREWKTECTIENSNCKFVRIALKKLDGTEFTDEELANACNLYSYAK